MPLQKVIHCHFFSVDGGSPGVDMARIHHLGQYLIKVCFKFGSKIVGVVLFLHGKINSTNSMDCNLRLNKKEKVS